MLVSLACTGDDDAPGVIVPPTTVGATTVAPDAPSATAAASATPAGEAPSPIVTPDAPVTRTLNVPILVYHHVTPELPDDFEQRTITVTTGEFEAQLAELQSLGYRSISPPELANALFYGDPIPDKSVMLTFDDGYDDAYFYATPLLSHYGFGGVFGIVTGYVGNPGYLTWDQLREMRDAGMSLVSHSVTHPDLGGTTDEATAAEIRDSKERLEEELGVPVQTFIYPYGEPFAYGTEAAQQRAVLALAASGYAIAITNPLPGEWPDIEQDASHPFELSRIMVSTGMSLERFALRLTGTDI